MIQYSNKLDYKNFKILIDSLCLLDYKGITNNIQYITERDYLKLNKKQYNDNIDDYNIENIINNKNQSNNNSKKEANDIINKNLKNINSYINSIREFDENERCRICFNSESTKENPKLRLCSCKDYIHLECLK